MKRFLLAAALALLATGSASAGTLLCNIGGLVGQQDCTVGSGLALSAGGVLTSTVAAGTPGGSSGQLQINSSGSFGGITLGGDCTFSSPNVTCTKTGGVSFAASATTDTTSATNISAGTLGAARLPNPAASTLGGVESIAVVSHNFLTGISTSGVPTQAQPACSDLSNGATGCSTAVGTIATQAASGVAITGGTLAGLTGLGLRDTSAAFDLTAAATSSTALTAGRTLTFDVVNGNRTVKVASGLTIATDPGAVSGAMKANGSGTFGQAACSDLSNAAGTCSSNALSALATQAANTAVANVTSGSAAPTAASLPSCTDTGGNHLNYTNGTGFSCGTSSGAAAGAETWISTQTAAAATSVSFTGLTTYRLLHLYCQMTVASADTLKIQFSTSTTFQTANYTGSQFGGSAFSSFAGTSNGITNGIQITGGNNANAAAAQPIVVNAWISDITSTITNKTVTGTASYTNSNSTGQMEILTFGGDYRGSQAAVDGIKVLTASAVNMTGICSLYGLAT